MSSGLRRAWYRLRNWYWIRTKERAFLLALIATRSDIDPDLRDELARACFEGLTGRPESKVIVPRNLAPFMAAFLVSEGQKYCHLAANEWAFLSNSDYDRAATKGRTISSELLRVWVEFVVAIAEASRERGFPASLLEPLATELRSRSAMTTLQLPQKIIRESDSWAWSNPFVPSGEPDDEWLERVSCKVTAECDLRLESQSDNRMNASVLKTCLEMAQADVAGFVFSMEARNRIPIEGKKTSQECSVWRCNTIEGLSQCRKCGRTVCGIHGTEDRVLCIFCGYVDLAVYLSSMRGPETNLK